MEEKLSSNLIKSGQMLIHSVQVKLRSGIAKSDRTAVFSNTHFSIFQKLECKKSFLWITLSSIKVAENNVILKFGKNVFNIYPSNIKLFLSCVFDVIQRVLLSSELESLDFESFHSFIAFPNPYSLQARIRMKMNINNVEYDHSLVQQITDTLSYSRRELDLTKFNPTLVQYMLDAVSLYYGLRSIKIVSSSKVDAYEYASKLVLEKSTLRLICIKGFSNSNFSTYISNLALNKCPKLMSLSFESSFLQEAQLNEIKNLYRKSDLKGLEFHDAISPKAKDFFHDSFFLNLRIKSLNLDGTKGLNLPRILILVPEIVLLSLADCDLDISDVIVQIQKLSKLRALNLSGNRCTNAAKLKNPLPPNVLSVHVNNVTWENQCLVEFFNYRLMKLSISYIYTSPDEWQRLFDSLPNNPNNALANIVWDGNNVHSNFFSFLKNHVCLQYLSMNDCFNQSHPECLSSLIDYLKFKDLALTEISLRGTDSNNIGEYLLPVLNVLLNVRKINTIDIHGQKGGDQSFYALMGNMDHLKVLSCDKMNPSKSAILFDLADKARSIGVCLSYPSEDISTLVHSKKMTPNESRALFNKFRIIPKRVKKQPPGVLYPPPSNSPFDFPFQAYKYHPNTDFPHYLKPKQFAFYDRAPPMAKIGPQGSPKKVESPQPSPHEQSPKQASPPHSPIQQNLRTFDPRQNDNPETTITLETSNNPNNQNFNQSYNNNNQINYNGDNQEFNQNYNYNDAQNYNYNNNYNNDQGFNQNYNYNNNQMASSQRLNTDYNRDFTANQRFNQTYNNNNFNNSNRNSPSSKGRMNQGNTSPNMNVYKEIMRAPPPRFVFEDDPITLEMSRDDETILPTIEDEFFPAYDDARNIYQQQQQQQQIRQSPPYVRNSTPSNRSKSRGAPSRNERPISSTRNRMNEVYIEEEEEFDDYDDNYNRSHSKNHSRSHSRSHRTQSSLRKHQYENENEYENENDIYQDHQPKSRSRANHRSTSRQRHQHHPNNNEYDGYDDDENNVPSRNKERNLPPSSQRVRRAKARIYYESNNEDLFVEEDVIDDYDNEESSSRNRPNHRKRSSSRNNHGVSPSRSTNSRANQRQQPQQGSSRRRKETNKVHPRNKRSSHYNNDDDYDDNNEFDNVDNYDYENDDDYVQNMDAYDKPKSQSQRRANKSNVQPKTQQRRRGKVQSHRSRTQKMQNENYNDEDDYDDDVESYHQPRTRQKQQQSRRQTKRRLEMQDPEPVPERRKQNVNRGHNQISRSQQQQQQQHRNRNNGQRMKNYNKDDNFDDYDYDNDNNDEFEQSEYDEEQNLPVKRNAHSQRNQSRNQSRRQNPERMNKDRNHSQRVVRSINHDGSPKPARRPAPRYVQQFEFSSSNSFE
ncbi:hypothetical protein M9Y10_045934 [Tritrichomonas musculus]|uniref:Leucine Rich Repeat family protein n=1 Tax=Tritrichomonas musculus TaxID=1915356 RepID=A0ABR2JWT6_9EUKA